jgi:sulfatase modifying factor 1
MKTTTALILSTLVLFCAAPTHAVTFDWATVGNPGNADDIPDQFDDRYGGVDYIYRISKHEVTNAQYAEFLNAVDPTGTNASLGGSDGFLYNANMSGDARGGINLNGGAANGSKYEIKLGRDNNPVVFVSFFDAMRFTNWLHNGQGSGSTESGVYTIGSGTDEVRSASAKYWIPSEDEWYKAAYYDPNGVYYDYPTGTDTVPYSDNPSSLNTPDDTNVANFFKYDSTANGYDDGYAVTGSTGFVGSQNYLTDVGAYSLAASPYGTFDQGGNVWEWNEAVISSSFRGLRGGSWNRYDLGDFNLHAGYRIGYGLPSDEVSFIGFRVATVPEPSTVLLGALAAAGVLLRRIA